MLRAERVDWLRGRWRFGAPLLAGGAVGLLTALCLTVFLDTCSEVSENLKLRRCIDARENVAIFYLPALVTAAVWALAGWRVTRDLTVVALVLLTLLVLLGIVAFFEVWGFHAPLGGP